MSPIGTSRKLTFGAFDVFYQEAPEGRPWVMRQRLGPRAP
jgi:hypothetical protein